MGARVLFRDSQGRDGQVDLTPTAPLYVGRALDCAIRTDDAMVSRKHSMIRMENGRFFVEDLGSSNGTHVNDVRVTKHLLNHNDVVRCGSLWLRYVEDGPIAVSGAALPQSPVVQPGGGGAGYGGGGGGAAAGYGGAAGGAGGGGAGCGGAGGGGGAAGYGGAAGGGAGGGGAAGYGGAGGGGASGYGGAAGGGGAAGYGGAAGGGAGGGGAAGGAAGGYGGAPGGGRKGGTQRLDPAELGIQGGGGGAAGGRAGGAAGGGGAGGYGGGGAAGGGGAGGYGGGAAGGGGAGGYGGGAAGGGGAGGYGGGAAGGAGSGGAGGYGGGAASARGGGGAGGYGAAGGGAGAAGYGGSPAGGGGVPVSGYAPTGIAGGGAAGRGAAGSGGGYAGGGAAGAAGGAVQLFGGPPAMPDGVVGGDLTPPPPRGPGSRPHGDEDSVVVDLSSDDVAKLRRDLDEALSALERVQAGYDREAADSKRLRAEIVTHKDRIEELRHALSEREDVVEAHSRVADELREEIRQAKDSLVASRTEAGEMSDLVAARERQIARTQEDMGQLKREIEDKERQLLDLSRTKDEGWRKLNEQLTEIDHLREVINQQERMLEERRVGLISQDEIIKELRGKEEQTIRSTAQLKAERDELKSDLGKFKAQVSAIDEENRRLTQMLAELRSKRGSASGGSGRDDDHEAAAHTAAVSAELKTLRIALKTVEADRDHLKQLADRSEDEVERLREQVANLEVDLRDAHDEKERAAAGKSVSDDAMARAEVARHKAAEEAVIASKAKEESSRLAAELKRELDKARRRIVELEEVTGEGTGPDEELVDANRHLERKLIEAGDRITALEGELRTARAERDAASRVSKQMKAVVVDDSDATAVVQVSANPAQIKDRAIDVHDAINDVLSELRNNTVILQEEFARDPSARTAESVRIMSDAIEAIVGQSEEAKGVLRRLRELVEFGDE